ncbi:FlgD immunoglobulin-like domain containing protein [Candidatus Eisenbacteria bacterium]|uniref:FlgD immunoglobulin-like domain containing protein n=1 Tax=Eiseniibacteriota bacterium TaxID=2212470 RepID=A0ABV6YJ66_UNCEI
MQDEFPTQLIVVENHIYDPFEIPWVVARADTYEISGYPSVVFDGINMISGAVDCDWTTNMYRTAVLGRLNDTGGTSPVGIQGSFSHDAVSLDASATFTLLDPVTLTNPTAVILLAEEEIIYETLHLMRVTRAVYEEPVTLVSVDEEAVVNAEFTLDPAWVAENLVVIAYLQRAGGNHEVYQTWMMGGDQHTPETYLAGLPSRIESVAPNPIHANEAFATIHLSISEGASNSPVRLDVLDANGRLIRRLMNRRMDSGISPMRWDGRDARGQRLDAGVYYLTLRTADGMRTARAVLMR